MTDGAPAPLSAPVADTGLRCPRCRYNLTGLAQPRCPECGTVFDWEDVRRAADPTPTIAFERARGRHRVPAFLWTALTVLFAPWVFARQVVRRARLRSALGFAALCLAATALSLLFDWAPDVYVVWMVTAAAYLPVQALALSLLDVPGWSQPLRALRFWLIVGGYTCAVMVPEIYTGPPLLTFRDLWLQLDWHFIGTPGAAPTAQWRFAPTLWEGSLDALIGWSQLGLWLAGPACCMYARWRTARQPRLRSAVAALLVVPAGLGLYAVAVEFVGLPLGVALNRWNLF